MYVVDCYLDGRAGYPVLNLGGDLMALKGAKKLRPLIKSPRDNLAFNTSSLAVMQ